MDLAINGVLVPDFEEMRFVKKSVGIRNGTIEALESEPIKAQRVIDASGYYLSAGLIDCHCHIESSHLLPSRFGNTIAAFGTLHAVCDCHEIANVFGREGLEFFMEEAGKSLANLLFAVPSCVPATEFATNGGRIDVEDVKVLMRSDRVVSLGELMNVPAVINGDERFKEMIRIARMSGKRVNGHAPHLSGKELEAYVAAGVEDDHESETYEELKEKIKAGMHVFLREGSAEKVTPEAYRIIEEYPDRVMFATDDKSVGDILRYGHINYNLKRAIELGVDPIYAFRAASYNGLEYYGLHEYSSVDVGKRAYLVLFDREFNIRSVIINGKLVTDYDVDVSVPKKFLDSIRLDGVKFVPEIEHRHLCIGAKDGSLITDKLTVDTNLPDFDLEKDMLKLAVFERYGHGNKKACRIKGFGLKKGAIASSLAHDCHNIVAVGTSDDAIRKVVNEVIKCHGGLALYDEKDMYCLPLEVGGIVSTKDARDVANRVELLKKKARELGSTLADPFGTLSFMALEVIPHLKLTDKGLFDVDRFSYV